MTHDEFREICLKEYPKIEQMIEKVKALGVDSVTCVVWSNGHINFDIHDKDDTLHTSYHAKSSDAGKIGFAEHGPDGESTWYGPAHYESTLTDDETEDDLRQGLGQDHEGDKT